MATGISTQYATTSRIGAIVSPPLHRSAYPTTSRRAAAPHQSSRGGNPARFSEVETAAESFGIVSKSMAYMRQVSSDHAAFNALLISAAAQDAYQPDFYPSSNSVDA